MRDLSNDVVVQINEKGISYLQFKVLLNLGVQHAFILKSDRALLKYRGRVSTKEEEIAAYSSVCDCLGWDASRIVRPIQKHTDVVKYIDKVYERFLLDGVDGLITNNENIVLTTTNADCILYLLYDKKNKIISNVHSGWRGSYQRIIEKTVDMMISKFGSDPNDIIICVCPSIRKCCFEVDQDVRDMFVERFGFLSNINDYILNGYTDGKFFIDTVGINNCLLRAKGIPNRNIYDSDICSVCNSDMIHSRRVEGPEYGLCSAMIVL